MSPSSRPAAGGERDGIYVSNVFVGEALLEERDTLLVCANGKLHYYGVDDSFTLAHDSVVDTRVDRDASVAGFWMIAWVFAGVAVLMAYLFTDVVVLGDGGMLSVIGLGSAASAVLSVASAIWFYQLDAGERVVLQLDCEDGDRVRFITTADTDAFTAIERRINNTVK